MAFVERNFVRDMTTPNRDGDVVLGDDWVAPDKIATDELRGKRARRGLFALRASPLTRKIITFNLIALNVLAAGILYLNSSRDSLAVQRGASLISEAELIADVFEAQLAAGGIPDGLAGAENARASLEGLTCVVGSKFLSLIHPSIWLLKTQGKAILSLRFRILGIQPPFLMG